MLLLVLALVGFAVGYALGMTKAGFLSLGAASIASSILQIAVVFVTADRTQATMLPLVAGTVIVAGMIAGALSRTLFRPSNAA
jgi:hypothetical protein